MEYVKQEHTTFIKCQGIRNSLLVRASRVLINAVQDKEKDGLSGIYDRIPEWEKSSGSFKIDPNDLTEKQMNDLGFITPTSKGIFADGDICSIPVWLFPFLAEEFIYSHNGDIPTLRKTSDMDISYKNQIDYAILNYGVIPKK